MIETKSISEEKNDIVKNLYISGISEEFLAMQIALEIPVVIAILKELGVKNCPKDDLRGYPQVFIYP
jgi:hypothetical protein